MPDLITTEEAADRLRVSRQTVYRLLARGELRGLRVGRGPKAHHRKGVPLPGSGDVGTGSHPQDADGWG